MSGSMAVGANYLSFTAGGSGAAGTGAYSVAALWQPGVGNNNSGVACLLASGTRQRTVSEDALKMFGEGDFTGFGTLVQGSWYLVVGSKAAGSAALTWRIWLYDPVDFTGALQDGTSQTVGDGSTVDEIRIGQTFNLANGLYAVLGVWNRQLSLAECQSMRSNQLSAWAGVAGGAPQTLIHLRDWNGTTGAVVAIGSNTFNSVTGTVSAGANPPSFNFDLATNVPDPSNGGAGAGGTSDGLTLGDGSGGAGAGGQFDGLALGDVTGGAGVGGQLDGLTLGDGSGGAGAGGVLDGLVLGDGSGGVGAGGRDDPAPGGPVEIQDGSGGVGAGGQADAISSVVHDQMVMPILQQVKTCLADELAKLARPPAKLQIRPGSVFTSMADDTTDECCAGIAYVRPNTDTPTAGNWPSPLFDVDGPSASRGAPAYYAVQVEIGIYRCIPVISNVEGNRDAIPTEDQWLQAAQEHLDDRAALRRTVCCLRGIYGSDGVLTGPYTPLQNEGTCGGQFVLLTIRAPACDC